MYQIEKPNNKSAAPARVLIFGGSGHIGGPAAEYIAAQSPDTAIRLVTSNAGKLDAMKAAHPKAECMVASYFDPASLAQAFKGVDKAFVLTPDWIDDRTAMTNVVNAAREAGTIRQIVRLVGDPPGIHSEADIPQRLRKWGGGTAIQHQIARKVLTESGLPMTFLNSAACFMDDFLTMLAPPLIMKRMLTVPPDHHMAWIDATDVGHAAAALMLSPDPRHIGKTYDLNNGHDVLLFSECAAMLSEVMGEKITYDGTVETFLEINGAGIRAWIGREDAADYFIDYFDWEAEQSTMWRKTDILQYLLGRPGKTLRAWFEENKHRLLKPPA